MTLCSIHYKNKQGDKNTWMDLEEKLCFYSFLPLFKLIIIGVLHFKNITNEFQVTK